MELQNCINENGNLWIFGYGSLVWKPDFPYKRSKVGHITGYKRRFWHGDDFHRGDKVKVRFVSALMGYYIVLAQQVGSSRPISRWLRDFKCNYFMISPFFVLSEL